MRVAVIGAGIIGVTTAFELGRDGHEVTVFERRGAVAEETSFANAGIVAPGYVTPWAAPGMPAKVLRQLFQPHASVRLAWPLRAAELRWAWHWYRNCTLEAYRANRQRLQRLAFYSRERLHALRDQFGLEYDRSEGYAVLLRSEQDARLAEPGLQLLTDAGVAFRRLDAAQLRKLEPALDAHTPLAGGIWLPEDEVGNCRQFALLLRNEAQRLGVRFEFQAAVESLRPAPTPGLRLRGIPEAQDFDAIVLCAGVDSAALLAPLGVHIPLVAVHGYSLSAAIREPLNAPRSAVMDEHFKVAIARHGQRIRVAGGAELGGQVEHRRQAPLRTLYKVLNDWFPGAVNQSAAFQEWKGARPMLPDGPPIVGASGVPGLWLNLGHGSSGWALSCGSARALADQVLGHAPEIDMQGLGIERLRD